MHPATNARCSVGKPLCSLCAFCFACVKKKKEKKRTEKHQKTVEKDDIWWGHLAFAQTIPQDPYHCACVQSPHWQCRSAAGHGELSHSGHPINRQKHALLASRMIALLSHNSTWTLANCSTCSNWPSRLTPLPDVWALNKACTLDPRRRRSHVSIVDRR